MSLDTPSLTIHMRRFTPEGSPRGKPVLLIPGYGMNSFILSYHPDGASLASSLVSRGLEVWTMDWKRKKGAPFDLGLIAREGVAAAVDHVLANTLANNTSIDLIGCSLGTTLLFSYLAQQSDESAQARIGSLVTLAGVVTWGTVHPLVRVMFASKRVIGAIPMRGTRALARAALPALASGAPGLLSLYVHAQTSNLSQPDLLVQTVEDPDSDLNREIAGWIKNRELVLATGSNVSAHMRTVASPLLCVLGRQDGVVQPGTARLVYEHVASQDKTLLEVGDETYPVAHADLFIGRDAEARVFRPVADFLLARP